MPPLQWTSLKSDWPPPGGLSLLEEVVMRFKQPDPDTQTAPEVPKCLEG